MNKILGLDLGTNSIGWAIRDIAQQNNQIIDKGVLTFEKGVGEGKMGEFPLVQKRTESRSRRRTYQAEKYRKWALLAMLIDHKMCPLSVTELDAWRKYTKGTGRRYPQSESFIQWLRFDFDGDGKPDFEKFGFSLHENHYLFRMLAISEDQHHLKIFRDNPQILGRVFYHLVQRRGFRGRDDEEAKTIMQGSKENGTIGADIILPFIEKYKTLGAALYFFQKDQGKGTRIRKRYNLRSDYERELKEICRVQNINHDIYNKAWKAIIWQRPLRSQKGLVGLCTFENNKPRCAISHPLYEEFRTWIFINNLRIQLPKELNKNDYIAESIYPLFYNNSRDFKLRTIANELKKIGGKITAKTGSDKDPKKEKEKLDHTKVVSATLLYNFKNLFGEEWKTRLGWAESLQNIPKNCPYSFEDIWHVLFTFDSREKLIEFAVEKLHLSKENAETFSKLKLQQGYSTLSLSAIKKILPYLRFGFLYSHAIYLANLPKVLGKNQINIDEATTLSNSIEIWITKAVSEKKLATVINSLISDQLNSSSRFGMDPNYQLDTDDKNDIERKLREIFGEKTWDTEKTETEKMQDYDFVAEKYLAFLRKPITTKKDSIYFRPERLHDQIFNNLSQAYNIPSERKKYLWHPSEQDTYLPAETKNGTLQLGEPQPISRGFKNPMALKTLHKLKYLLNYLLQTNKIDEETSVVIEIARELNDANRRKAIEKWQREREKENDEFRKRIEETAKENNITLNVSNRDVVNKYRLWIEQNRTCLYTGALVNFSDLFNGAKYDFEHTIPASISFDNELTNLTIADGFYNKQIKQNKFPTQLPNYDQDMLGYTAIQPRLKYMEDKIEQLATLLNEWVMKTSFASTKEIKDACIQRRHMIRFELDYWRKKLHTFTLTEYKAGWRNSQLRDTQIVTKYALPYLKTVFNRVEVEKGTVTAVFREIYGIQAKQQKKDRSKHSHHALDAAVLTLIPPAPIRDKILLQYNSLKDENPNATYHEPVRQWKSFKPSDILSIEPDVLINFQPQQRTLTQTYKKVRKRGKEQFVKEHAATGRWRYKVNEKGEKIRLIATGDTIRGQLHKESFFGAIRLDGEKCLVERYPIASFTNINDCKHIVDNKVKEIVTLALEKRLAEGMTFDKAKLEPIHFPNGKEVIKKVRCKVAAGRGYLTPEKALSIKMHTFISKHDYKHFVYAQNEENTLCLFYDNESGNINERAFKIIGLYELAELKIKSLSQINQEKYYSTTEIGRGKNKKAIPLKHIITVGTKVILYKENKEELKELLRQDLFKRVFRVYKFNEPAPSTVYIYLQNHLEARSNDELGNGQNEINLDAYQPRVFLKASRFNCAIEQRDFRIHADGEIEWLF